MEAILKIPKILEQVEDINKHQASEQAFIQYKKNVKSFIQMITKQMVNLIHKYETQISRLSKENQSLKSLKQNPEAFSKQTNEFTKISSPSKFKAQSPSKFFGSNISPIKSLNLMNTAKSNFISSDMYKINRGLTSADLKFQSLELKRNKIDDYQFPEELIRNSSPTNNLTKSRFEANHQNKKRREGDIIQFIQSTKKNLDMNAQKFFQVIGRSKGAQISENTGADNPNNSDSSKSKDKPEELNSSLGSICNSLDNSFISRKAKSQKKKRVNVEEDLKKKKKQKEEQMNKMTKQRGLMNLLKQLRDNVNSSPNKSPEIIKQSKLFSCGPKQAASKQGKQSKQIITLNSKKSSKVMINPVPVDIVKKKSNSKKQKSKQSAITKASIDFKANLNNFIKITIRNQRN